MEIKEGFKQTEVGVIPSDWEVGHIDEITSLMTNGFVGTVKTHYTDFDNGILYIQGYNIEENSFNFNGIKRVTHEFHKQHSKSCLQEGDLLTIQTGDIGVTTVVPKELEGANCHALIITRFKKETADPKFYSYYFNFSEGRKRLKEIETGSTMKHINVGDMIQMLIPYPTKAEQTAIATALNDADAFITELEKLIAKKRAIKQGAMQELLKPKEGWKVKKLRKVFKFLKTANNSRADLLQDGEFEYIHYGDIHTKWNSFLDCSKNVLPFIPYEKIKSVPFLQEGDLIIADASEDYEGLGACIEIKSIGNRKIVAGLHTMLLRGDKEIILDGFKGYFRNFHGVKEALIASSTGVSVYGISKSKLKDIEIKIPTKETQTRIAQILSDMDAEIEALENKLNKYKMIKQGMIQNLLTGWIRLV